MNISKLLLFSFLAFSHSTYSQPLMIGCWIPYWKTETGIQTVRKHFHLFDQVSLFSLEIHPNGKIKNTMTRHPQLWKEFKEQCRKHKKPFIPTIYWSKTKEFHDVLSDRAKRNLHITQIVDYVTKNECDGININYEKMASVDRDHYIAFMQELSKRLHHKGLLLHTTIGGRTSDNTIGVLTKPLEPTKNSSKLQRFCKVVNIAMHPGSGADARRYKKMIAECCDQVIIMGYDEWGRPYARDKEHLKNNYFIAHASNQWIEQIILHALSYIPAHKLVLAVPKYGLEFAVYRGSDKISLKKKRNLNFPRACEIAALNKKSPKRTAGGELSYTYKINQEERYVCYLDHTSIQDKLDIIRKYNLKGVYFFTITGLEDQNIWPVLEREHAKKK